MTVKLSIKAKSLDAINGINDYLEYLEGSDVTLMFDQIFSDNDASDSAAAKDEFIFTCGTDFDPEAANTDFDPEATNAEPPVPEFVFTCGKPSQYGDFFL